MSSRLITRVVGWTIAFFYDVERTGPGLEPGPVLVAANHPNALVDPLVIFHTGGRPSRPLAKAPLFEQALVGLVLKLLGGLPVYRKQDDPAQMHLNQSTFDAAIAALHRGEAVQIYPEGQSHSEPSMTPLRTGAARIALMSESQAEWSLGLQLQPVGLTYERKPLFRGRAMAAYGRPIRVADYEELYRNNERDAVRALTEELRQRLFEVTLNVQTVEDRDLVALAERIWIRETGDASARDRQPMSERMPRMRRFAKAYARLSAEDPARAADLRAMVRRYQRVVTALGVREAGVPTLYRPARVLGYAAWQLTMLVLVAPVAAVGMLFWGAPFVVTRFAAASFRPKLDQVATYKLGVGCMAFPAWLALVGAAVGVRFGWQVAATILVIAPLTGMAAVAWRARGDAVRENVRIFRRVWRRKGTRDRLGEMRSALVESFQAVSAEWTDGPAPGTPE